MPLARSVDRAFFDFVFYPEAEWARFGYRPPENAALSGAWRDSSGTVVIFLLRTADFLEPASGSKPLLLYVSGPHAAVDAISKRVMALKSVLAKMEHKELRVLDAGHRIEQENRFPGNN
jgi:hypothetical protein